MNPELLGALVVFLNVLTAYLVILTKDATTKNRKSIQKVNARIEEANSKQLFVCSKCGAAESSSGLLRVEADE